MYSARLRRLSRAPWGRGCHAVRLRCQAALDLRADVAEKRQSAKEVVQSCIEKIRAREEALGSFITIDEEGALAQVCL